MLDPARGAGSINACHAGFKPSLERDTSVAHSGTSGARALGSLAERLETAKAPKTPNRKTNKSFLASSAPWRFILLVARRTNQREYVTARRRRQVSSRVASCLRGSSCGRSGCAGLGGAGAVHGLGQVADGVATHGHVLDQAQHAAAVARPRRRARPCRYFSQQRPGDVGFSKSCSEGSVTIRPPARSCARRAIS